jgi:hypothetical protein
MTGANEKQEKGRKFGGNARRGEVDWLEPASLAFLPVTVTVSKRDGKGMTKNWCELLWERYMNELIGIQVAHLSA